MRAANEIINVFEASNPEETIEKARKIAEDMLGEGWQKEAEAVWDKGGEKSNADAKLRGLGHWSVERVDVARCFRETDHFLLFPIAQPHREC